MLEMDNHLQTMNIEEQRMVAEPIEGLKEIPLNNSKPDQTTKIGTFTSLPVCQALMTFVKENQDIFSWSHKDIPRIDLLVMVHRLNVLPTFLPIRQKKLVFAQE